LAEDLPYVIIMSLSVIMYKRLGISNIDIVGAGFGSIDIKILSAINTFLDGQCWLQYPLSVTARIRVDSEFGREY
jgi:hypothetical protein